MLSVMLSFIGVTLQRIQLHKNLVCLPRYNVQSSSRRYIQQIKCKYLFTHSHFAENNAFYWNYSLSFMLWQRR